MPVQTQINFREKKSQKKIEREKSDKGEGKTIKRRKEKQNNENVDASPAKIRNTCIFSEAETSCKPVSRDLFSGLNDKGRKSTFIDGSVKKPSISNIKKVLHCASTDNLPGREKEIRVVEEFIDTCLKKKCGGSLYVSGYPGTGKSASITLVLKRRTQIKYCLVNCMSLQNPAKIFSKVGSCFDPKWKSSVGDKMSMSRLRKSIFAGNLKLVVLDEIDQLDTKDHNVLCSFFEWAGSPNSKLVLVGIANSLNLTDQIYARLGHSSYQPQLLNFEPYNNEQIYSILKNRLSQVEGGTEYFQDTALQFLSRKVASTTGDLRKGLNLCERALDLAEQISKENVLKPTCDDGLNPGSPSKSKQSSPVVDINIVMRVLQGLHSNSSATILSNNSFPIVQKIAIAALLFCIKNGTKKDCCLGKWYDAYKIILTKKNLDCVCFSEFSNICMLLESRGYISVKVSKEPRLNKVLLRLQESEVEAAFEDKTLLTSILSQDKNILTTRA